MRLRMLPSTEGFRRIAIAVAIVTFIVLLVGWLRDDARERERLVTDYRETYLTEEQRCWNEFPAASAQACVDRASDVEQKKIHRTYDNLFRQELGSGGFYAIGAMIWAYLAALCIRTLGWIALGFGKPIQS